MSEGSNRHFTQDLAQSIQDDASLGDEQKTEILKKIHKLKETKVHILVTGATGCGKSSTINALFQTEKAKVGQGADPETMSISQYELENIVIFDSPGLGDGKEADIRHSKGIISKLLEKDKNGDLLIDMVLVILDGSSRDLGTSFQLIENVIIPYLGEDQSRLLIAINQADIAMKGHHWNDEKNQPEPTLLKFLDEKAESSRRRIKEATGVDADVIYYAAGYKDGDSEQKQPWNLSKLMLHILKHTKEEKRAVFIQDMNKDPVVWESNHDKNTNNTIGEILTGGIIAVVTKGLEKAVEWVTGGVKKVFDTVGSFFRFW